MSQDFVFSRLTDSQVNMLQPHDTDEKQREGGSLIQILGTSGIDELFQLVQARQSC